VSGADRAGGGEGRTPGPGLAGHRRDGGAAAVTAAVQVKARRGDLAVLVCRTRIAQANGPGYTLESAEVTVVASVTRGGEVKAVRDVHGHVTPLARYGRLAPEVRLVPAANVDVAAAMQAAREHVSELGFPTPYGSLDEARAALRRYARTDGGARR